jgi:3-oxoacyl-[acyl-carrier protein] reductase
VLVTGGSRGIGAACVQTFHSAGWNVFTIALAGGEKDAVHTRHVLTVCGDITEPRARELAIRKTLATFGRIDAPINNAGVGLYSAPAELLRDLFLRLVDVNVFAPLAMA